MGCPGLLFGKDWTAGGVGEAMLEKREEMVADRCGRYANGKATALVVDVGHNNTSVTALWEGMVLKKSEFRSPPALAHVSHDEF